MVEPIRRITFKEQDFIHKSVNLWLQSERLLAKEREVEKTAYFNIASYNLCSISQTSLDKIMSEQGSQNAVVRLKQVYLLVVTVLGLDRYNLMLDDLIESLEQLHVPKARELVIEHPYVGLVPIANSLIVHHMITSKKK